MAALTSHYTIRASNPQTFRIVVTLGKYQLQSELTSLHCQGLKSLTLQPRNLEHLEMNQLQSEPGPHTPNCLRTALTQSIYVLLGY